MSDHPLDLMSVKDVARTLNISVQGVGMAIRRKTLKHIKKGWRFYVRREELNRYIECKRKKEFHSNTVSFGNAIFNYSKGILDAKEVAKRLDCHIQHVYYLCRTKQLVSKKYGGYYVIFQRDLRIYSSKLKRLLKKIA